MALGSGSVIASGARTPIGKLLGAFTDLSAAQLGGIAIRAALERAGAQGSDVDYVIMGQVLLAGAGQLPARQAAVAGGLPMTVPAMTLNKVCLSGLDAIALADQLIRAGEFETIVAGGMESMTNAPHLLPKSRAGFKFGTIEMLDSMAYDGLTDAFDHMAMGESTEGHNAHLGITREEQDAFAARSHQRAAMAQKDGLFDDEIVAVPVPQRRGEPVMVTHDEGIREDTTVESLARLRPAFSPDGTITAGSASQISDGACAVLVTSRENAEGGRFSPRSVPTGWSRGLTTHCTHNRRTRSPARWPANNWHPPRSICSRSTRRLPQWRSSRCASSRSTRRWSTSMAARSRSATRSGCQERASPCI
jgi:acetyl-CoA C-acetyltransferase